MSIWDFFKIENREEKSYFLWLFWLCCNFQHKKREMECVFISTTNLLGEERCYLFCLLLYISDYKKGFFSGSFEDAKYTNYIKLFPWFEFNLRIFLNLFFYFMQFSVCYLQVYLRANCQGTPMGCKVSCRSSTSNQPMSSWRCNTFFGCLERVKKRK